MFSFNKALTKYKDNFLRQLKKKGFCKLIICLNHIFNLKVISCIKRNFKHYLEFFICLISIDKKLLCLLYVFQKTNENSFIFCCISVLVYIKS